MSYTEKLNERRVEVRPKNVEPFDIRDGRAMVSLGPVSAHQHCVYKCPFCYVNYEYLSYQIKNNEEIIDWLHDHRREYDIVYISGDTDSFAGRKRQERAVDLIERLVDLDVEIMITTRAVIDADLLQRIEVVVGILNSKGLNFFGCVSITQFSQPHIEPKPIPPVADRVAQLGRFKRIGMVSVLAMRPFLPVVPDEDYRQILDNTKGVVDIVLGKMWYSDVHGNMYQALCNGGGDGKDVAFVNSKMDFDVNMADWNVYESIDTEKLVMDICDKNDVAFFMTSRPAVDWARSIKKRIPKIIGIGALNVNFLLKDADSKRSAENDDDGSNENVWEHILETTGSKFDENYSSIFLGGGAYHVVECLRYLHARDHLSLAYIGVAGKDIQKVRMEDGGFVSFSISQILKANDIDSRYVKDSSQIPGITLNRRSGVRSRPEKANRSNTTNAYANDELADFLSGEDQYLLEKYISTSDWIHLSSLFDVHSMRKISSLLVNAKAKNHNMKISWDVGSLHKDLLLRKPVIRNLLRVSDFVILSSKELRKLSNVVDKSLSDREAVRKLYTEYSGGLEFSLFIQGNSFDVVDIYWSYRDTVLTRSVKHSRVSLRNGPIDITAASAYLSAALIDAKLRPDTAFEMRESIQYGIDLVWSKLTSMPEDRALAYRRVRDKFITRLNGKMYIIYREFIFSLFLRFVCVPTVRIFYGIISYGFIVSVIAGLVAAVIILWASS